MLDTGLGFSKSGLNARSLHGDDKRRCSKICLRPRLPDLFLVGLLDGEIIATVMAGYDGHRGWVNYLAVDPKHQGQGLGRELMNEVERRLREEGCPKINLQVRAENKGVIEFYRRLGYAVERRKMS